ncbi:MAG TPA: hypothetical protein VJP76_03495 [Candidatus Tumulicola sp.]|nr:hypothetical protein [Candidatus Tumulicola sp.]
MTRRAVALAAAIPALCAAAAMQSPPYRAIGTIAAAAWPYLPGSVIPIRVDGFSAPYQVALAGPGSLHADGSYAVPAEAAAGSATLIVGNASGIAERRIRIAAPPSVRDGVLAVASYDRGIVFHDPRTFAPLGVLATGGTPSDAVISRDGRLAATDTQGSSLALVTLDPWRVGRIEGVPLGDEVAVDDSSGAIFVTDRESGAAAPGGGALTRIAADGRVSSVVTGQTPEGLAIDRRRGIVYVANVNDGTIAAVDARTMRVERRFKAIARVFSLVLSSDGSRLYAISNQSAGSPFAAPGAAIAIALRPAPHVVARSGDLTFPLGAALDSKTGTLFVTDESRDAVDVLDARTLRAKRAPLSTCRTPWKPEIDPVAGRLYVPCARADAVDVFDTRTLRRAGGAPFATGSYPLAVAVWHRPPAAKAPANR